MKRVAFTLNLRNDPKAIAAYKEYHRNVWPEIEQAQHRLGVEKMRIFLHGRQLFLYMETKDDYYPQRDFAKFLKDPKVVEWERVMRELQEQLPEAGPEEWWLPMELIYAMD